MTEMAKKTVVYELPGMDAATVLRDLPYGGDGGARVMDVYRPAGADPRARLPVVVIVAGYPEPGLRALTGCGFREMGQSVSWARLLAASGLAAVVYSNQEPERDLAAVLDHLHREADALGIDAARIGLHACSGNVPLALSRLLRDADTPPRCAAFCYGFLLDLDGSSAVAEAAAAFGFANPCAGRSVSDLRSDVPLLLAKAGRDQFAGINDSMDRFRAEAERLGLPVSFVEHPTGAHAFDLEDDSDTSRDVIVRILAFLSAELAS